MVSNRLKLIENNIKITGIIIIYLICIYLLSLTIAEVTKNFYALLTHYSNLSADYQTDAESQIYVPPNFGGPDSSYGSGRR
ncbi:MAG TPA: hypothetical protein VK184_20965 [Nostocaceae cyanobacterium]|nr:hypothetical protein [Nostocaceae cyanobacterium]